jgi:Flp pilus assembly pilin Flp
MGLKKIGWDGVLDSTDSEYGQLAGRVAVNMVTNLRGL